MLKYMNMADLYLTKCPERKICISIKKRWVKLTRSWQSNEWGTGKHLSVIQLSRQTLPVEKMGKQSLCMMQYYKILCGCRIPGKKKDTWVCYPPDEANPPRHLVIAHNNAVSSVNDLIN